MRKNELHPKEQVFRYEHDGKVIFIAVDRVIRKVSRTPVVEMDVMEPYVKKLLADKSVVDVEVHRYMKLFSARQQGDKNVSIMPGLVIVFKDDTWTLADGNNKYVAAYMCGEKKFRIWQAQRQDWAPFIVRDLGSEVAHGETIVL